MQIASTWNELKRLFGLMIPILITQFAQAGLGFIDTIMAGRFSSIDLAAIAVGVGIWLPVMLLFTGIILATTPLVAEATGAKQRHQLAALVQHAMRLAVILGLIAFVILQLMPLLLPWLKVPASLHPKASLFLHSIAFGLPAVCIYTVLRCYSEALGYPRPVTFLSLASLVVLVPLNYLFMHGIGPLPALGSAGCGIATAVLQWLMLLCLATYISKASIYQEDGIFSQWQPFSKALIQKVFFLGLPIGLALFFEVSVFSMAAIIISVLGETVVAAHQIAISITSQLFTIPLSLGIALSIRVGTYYGEKNWAALKEIQILSLITAASMAFLIMAFLIVFKSELTALYTDDAHVATITIYLLSFCVMYQLVDGLQMSASGCLRGMQDTKSPMWVTLFAYWGITLPLSIYWIRFNGQGAEFIWIGLIIGLSIACVLLLARLYYLNKTRISNQ